LDDLFLEEKRRIIGIVLQGRFQEYFHAFERLADQDEIVLNMLGRLNYPIPRPLKVAATTAFDQRLRHEVESLRDGGSVACIKEILDAGKVWGYQPEERDALGKKLGQELRDLIGAIDTESNFPVLTGHADQLLDAAVLLGVPLDLWQTQNHLLDAYTARAASPMNDALKQAFLHLAGRLNINPNLLGWRP
jgi:hypothetical protein